MDLPSTAGRCSWEPAGISPNYFGVNFEHELREATEAARAATDLVHAQEAKIAAMKAAGMNTSEAESLLASYRSAVQMATERRNTLHALHRPQK
jgi:hypothetical protein